MSHISYALVKVICIIGGLFSAAIMVLLFATLLIRPLLPDINNTAILELKVPFKVYTSDGKLMGEFGNEQRIPIQFEDAPELLIKAVLAAEDNAFFSHPGIDIKSLARAILANLNSSTQIQGASTITMQVAKNFFLTSERTYSRKLKELFLAFQLEQHFEKEQILELYLNKIFLGHRAYGFEAASKIYYGKSLNELTLPQLAMLAGLPKAPSRTNPLTLPDKAKERRNYVLRRMAELGYINEQEQVTASLAPITAKKHLTKLEFDAPYVAEMVRRQLIDTYGEEVYGSGLNVYTTLSSDLQIAADQALRSGLMTYDRRHGYLQGGLNENENQKHVPVGHLIPATVKATQGKTALVILADTTEVTLDWDALERRVKSRSGNYFKPRKSSDLFEIGDKIYLEKINDQWLLAQIPEISGALVSLDPSSGAIRALSGGFDFNLSKFNRVTQAKRQAGSNIKPFIYSAALEKGYRADSKVSAEPIAIKDDSIDEGYWKPGNYNGKFYGYTSLREALSKSLNLVSVRLLKELGIDIAIKHLERFGFDSNTLPNGLSLALGSADVTPLQLASAYAIFANGGYKIEPYFIERIEDQHNNIVYYSNSQIVCGYCLSQTGQPESAYALHSLAYQRPAKLVLSPANAYVTNDMLKQVIRTGTAVEAKKLGRNDLGGKTGTTNDFKDAWFSGFNNKLVSSVWVGFDQPKTLGRRESATRVALPIWIDYMRVALKQAPETLPVKPDNIRHTGSEIIIASNRPEYKDKTLILDMIQKETEEKAHGLF